MPRVSLGLNERSILTPLLTLIWQLVSTVKTLNMVKVKNNELKKWRDQKWVRIGTDGKIKGECGTSKDKKNPDRCLPAAKAKSLSKKQRSSTAKKKKREGSRGKTVVKNTKAAEVKLSAGGLARKRRNHKGCGAVMDVRRKKTLYV